VSSTSGVPAIVFGLAVTKLSADERAGHLGQLGQLGQLPLVGA
jgi:hypothetical protein